MILAMGLMVLVLLGIATFLSYLDTLSLPGITVIEYLLSKLVSFALLMSIFLLLYKFTPRKTIYWRDIWLGSLIGAIAFQIALVGFTIFIRRFADYQLVYGSLASLVVILVWIYISSFILIICAEINSVHYSMFRQHTPDTPPDKNTTLN